MSNEKLFTEIGASLKGLSTLAEMHTKTLDVQNTTISSLANRVAELERKPLPNHRVSFFWGLFEFGGRP